jgi:hypothetical protein
LVRRPLPGESEGGVNHKRRRPKSRRAGCLLCKSWKHQRAAKTERFKPSELRAIEGCKQQEREE